MVGTRQSNASVESWFKTVKYSISPTASTPATFCRNMKKSISGRLAFIKKRLSKKHSLIDPHSSIRSQENWRSKKKRKNGYFSSVMELKTSQKPMLAINGRKLLIDNLNTLKGSSWLDAEVRNHNTNYVINK